MKASVKKKWIAALTSGEYKQGHGYLFNETEGGYCCLGVLASVVDPGKVTWHDEDGAFGNFVDGKEPSKDHRDYKRFQAQKKLLCGIIPQKRVAALTKMNDDTKWSFSRIAKYVERYI